MFAAGDLFGFSLGLSADGNTLAVGVYDEGGSSRSVNGMVDNMRGGSGAAYVFARTGQHLGAAGLRQDVDFRGRRFLGRFHGAQRRRHHAGHRIG